MALVTFTTPIENVSRIVSHYQIGSFTYDGINLYFESANFNSTTFAQNYATVDWTSIILGSHKTLSIGRLRALYDRVLGFEGTVQGQPVVISHENALMLLVSQGAFIDVTLPSSGDVITINPNDIHSFTSEFLNIYFQRYAAYMNASRNVYEALTIAAVDAVIAAYEASIV